jgi:hypothetical protein
MAEEFLLFLPFSLQFLPYFFSMSFFSFLVFLVGVSVNHMSQKFLSAQLHLCEKVWASHSGSLSVHKFQ